VLDGTTSQLHLVTMGEDPTFGTVTASGPGVLITTLLTDASVTCSDVTPNEMAVDAIPGNGIDDHRAKRLGETFDVDIVVTDAPNTYKAEQYQLQWDPALLAFDSETPTLLDGLTLCGLPSVGANTVYSGCGATAPTTATGPVHTVTFHCAAEGTSPLHLVSLDEDPTFGTTTSAGPSLVIPTTLIDASVTCSVCPYPDDSDCDGCADVEELGTDPDLGGTRDPFNGWDFYDVPVPTLFSGGHISGDGSGTDDRDHAITIIDDLLAVLEYSGTSDGGLCNSGPDGIPGNADDRCYDQDVNSDGVDDGRAYDRSVGATRSGAPDSAVTIIVDVLSVLAQTGQSCGSTPP